MRHLSKPQALVNCRGASFEGHKYLEVLKIADQTSINPEIYLQKLEVVDGEAVMHFKSEVFPIIAEGMVKMFQTEGGVNFLSWRMTDLKAQEHYELTLQRCLAKTPGEVVAELKARIVELEQLQAQVPCWTWWETGWPTLSGWYLVEVTNAGLSEGAPAAFYDAVEGVWMWAPGTSPMRPHVLHWAPIPRRQVLETSL